MSTPPAEVRPNPESVREPGTLPEFESKYAPSPKRWRWFVLAAAAFVLVALVMALLRSPSTAPSRLTQVITDNPGQVLRLKGTTEAVEARAILAPLLAGQQIGTLTIIHLAPGGTKVKQGDLLVEFDRQAQMRDIVDKQAEYQKLVAQVAAEQAKETAARAKDETELKTAE